MNRSIRILSALVLISTILSCKKEKDGDSNNPNQTRLSKIISCRTATPSKNILTTEFTYDDQKRVVEIALLVGDSVNGEIKSAKNRSVKYYYNGTDKSPYMSIGGIADFNSDPTVETFHSYNATGSLIRDSSVAPPPSNPLVLKRYFYSTNKIIVQNENKSNILDPKTKDSFIVANQNLSEAYTYINSNYNYVNGYKISYDDKINPLSILNIASITVTNAPYGFPSYLMPGSCKNNITEYTYGTSTGPGQFTGQNVYYYTYSYNANSLPEECTYKNGAFTTLIKFFYIE